MGRPPTKQQQRCSGCGGPIPSAVPQWDRGGKCYSCADLDAQNEMDDFGRVDPEQDIF